MKIPQKTHQHIRQLQKIYATKKKEITRRLREFSKCLSEKSDEEIFSELAFCLLTPQSKAFYCWDAIQAIIHQNLLFTGSENVIARKLRRVRFHNKKAHYLVQARDFFMNQEKRSIRTLLREFSDVYECREWLVRNIKGLGYKEASHFLRNIGLGESIAILDRHILKNLYQFGVIQDIPSSISRAKYMELEKRMAEFSRTIQIPISHLDLLLWYKETGEIFK